MARHDVRTSSGISTNPLMAGILVSTSVVISSSTLSTLAPASLSIFFFSRRRRHTRYWRDWSSDVCFFFSSRRRHTRYWRDWSSDVCSSDLHHGKEGQSKLERVRLLIVW